MHEKVVGSAWGSVKPRLIAVKPNAIAKGHPPKGGLSVGLIPIDRDLAPPYKTSRPPFQRPMCRQEDLRRWRDLHEYPANEATVISRLLDVAMDEVESVMATVERHESDKREETLGTTKNSENEANQLHRAFRECRSVGWERLW